MLRKILFLFAAISLLQVNSSSAQDWVNKMLDPSVNFYDVKSAFEAHWKKEIRKAKFKNFFSLGAKNEDKLEGITLYKRWENYMMPRVYPSGDRSIIEAGNKEIAKSLTDPAYRTSRLMGGNWQPLGSFAVPTNGGGAGRLNCVTFHPFDPNTIYVGAPAGGLWKSTDNGNSWTTNTDHLPTLGVNDIAIDPTNTNIMYIGTGDIDAGDTYGVGVLKSTDAGATWNTTGLNWMTSQGRSVSKILINPNNPNMIFAATTNGVYKSIDQGITWLKTLSLSNIKDLEFKPSDPTVLYAASAVGFYRSTNSGSTFLLITSGLPPGFEVNRIAIAVTPANADYVYLLYSSATDSGFHGCYRSTNSGSNFSFQSNFPNVLGYDSDGTDTGGNGWYTLAIAASPVDADEVMVGGVNVYKSNDGGSGWSIVSHWYGDAGIPYVHADIHNLVYRPDGTEFFAACDGGLFRTLDGGGTWQDKSNGMQINEMYRLGNAATDPDIIAQGWQDNGTNLYTAGSWERILGGDGMECFIDWSDPSYVYAEYQNGGIHRSSNGGSTFTDIKNDIDEDGEWVTPWCQDPIVAQTIYAGFKNVWKSTNRGNNWSKISTFNSSGLTCLAVSKSNPLYIYASNGTTIYKTADGGTTWNNLSAPGANYISYIAVSESDPNKVWITRSGYTDGQKVYKSIDGALTWTNLSGSLPNIPANCIVNQAGTSDGVYVGTDVGIYYVDNTLSSWMPY
ncbi:MAG: glycosyl hydrolase, partial [Bacteroidota bacterium]|nr:glycosyl hydrolase [Bacteroidota bacterium]